MCAVEADGAPAAKERRNVRTRMSVSVSVTDMVLTLTNHTDVAMINISP